MSWNRATVRPSSISARKHKNRDAIRLYRDFIATAPDELNAYFGFHMLPPAPFVPDHLHGVNVCMILSCYVGPSEQGEELVKPIRQFGPPVLDLLSPMPFPLLNSLFDALLPAGLQNYWKAHFVMTENLFTKAGNTI